MKIDENRKRLERLGSMYLYVTKSYQAISFHETQKGQIKTYHIQKQERCTEFCSVALDVLPLCSKDLISSKSN